MFFGRNAVRLAMKWYGLQLGFLKVNIVSDMGNQLLQKTAKSVDSQHLAIGVCIEWSISAR